MSRLAFGACILATGLVAMSFVPQAFAQSKTVINCSDSKVMDKLPANCKRDLISADGSARPFGIGAASSALTNWQREVRRKYGEAYVVWNNAACGTISRTQSGIGVIGGTLRRDTVVGFPCSPPDSKSAVGVPSYETTEKGKPLTKNQIDELQTRLVKAGYKIKVDGLWGGGTRKALQSWQKTKGLAVTPDEGAPDITDLEALRKAQA